ncbi:MAG: T9SS type A sorting domain-containing protein [Saprospiraceae bacterium]|nr:T9SS type A sorting domain-containing protein [Saprospiraceae bacterium]
MKMKTIYLAITCLALTGLGFLFFQNNKAKNRLPAPTNGTAYRTGQEEGEDGQARREAWIEMLHKAAPGTDWRAIDRQNLRVLQDLKASLGNGGDRAIEFFADSTVMGEWTERGSDNQAGNLRTVDYHAPSDQIYAISEGGSVWRGGTDNEGWQVLNDDRRFNPRLIKAQSMASGGVRILAPEGKILFYSDDEGLNWQQSQFSPDFYDGWGSPRQLVALASEPNTLYYLVETWDNVPWEPRIWLYRSTDNGSNFTRIKAFDHGETSRISLWQPLGSDQIFLLDRNSAMYRVEADSVPLQATVTGLPADTELRLTGSLDANSLPVFYALSSSADVYRSNDGGQNWALQGSSPSQAWEVGMICSPFNPDHLILGEVNCQESKDGGATWNFVNEWWEYYGDINTLHADIMDLKAFRKTDGTPFLLIANHGGLHISYDEMETTQNIGLSGLGIGQYYDVLTNPAYPNYIYLGSQDQGWQWTNEADQSGPSYFKQQLSGDYGMMQLSNNYQSIWVQYPGGDFSFYADALGLFSAWGDSNWNLPEGDVPALDWIVPTAPTAYANGNSIFVAGGNINEGQPGSHLITLSASSSPPFGITADQFNFDFLANSNTGNGHISAIRQSELDPDRLFVSTDDGTFFRSLDAGSTWEKSQGFTGPPVDWIYTACILASKKNPDLVWISGSGYSNQAVFKSENGGQTFSPMTIGLPHTLVQEIVANPDESLIFAATAVGPYVFVVEKNRWFPLIGAQTPLQWYTCVEYVDFPEGTDDIVRFGSYGRGVWDFKISEPPPSATSDASNGFMVNIYPNPATKGAVLRAAINAPTAADFELLDLNGRVVAAQKGLQNQSDLALGTLPSGVYAYRFSKNGRQLKGGKLVVQ